MEEKYLRQIRDLLVLQLAEAIALDPGNATRPDDIERVLREGHTEERVRFEPALDQAIAKFKRYQQRIDSAIDF